MVDLLSRSILCHSFPLQPLTTQPQRTTSTARFVFNFFDPKKSKDDENTDPKSKPTSNVDSNYVDEDDPVEKIFSFFFGKKEESPLGLKRFGKERFPEQYPATVDTWADPVASDDREMARLRPVLKNTNLETRALQLSYDANRNGWNPEAFHKAVDRKGPGIVVCTTQGGLVCGGYNPKGWVGYGELRGSIAAFLFVLNDSKGRATATKLRKVGGPSMAQLDVPEAGPSFGADGLVVPLSRDNPRLARSKLGTYYERFPDGTNSLFGREGASVQLKDLKVYHGRYAKDEFIPFTDADLNLFQ